MAEDQTVAPVAEELAPPMPAPDTDWFLQLLVDSANDEVNQLGVTLFVGGSIITGTLTSFQSYFDNLGDEVEHAHFRTAPGSDPIPAELKAKLGDIYRAVGKQTAEMMTGKPKALPQFIHLRDALVITAGQPAIPGNRRVWWRGRISRVDGYLIGNMEPGA